MVMLRLFICLTFYIVFYLVSSHISMAQPISYLKPNADLLRQARKIEQEARQHHNSKQLANAWFRYGEAYEQVGDNARAEPNFLNALRLLEPYGESSELAKLYLRLAELEIRQKHFDEATRFSRQELSLAMHLNLPGEIVEAYLNLGQIKSFVWNGSPNRTNLDSAFFWYAKADSLALQSNDTLNIARANVFRGALWAIIDVARAMPYLQKALLLFTHLNNNEWRVRTLIHLSTAYRRTGQLTKAGEYIWQADKIYKEMHLNEHGIQAMLEDRLSQYLEATGQWEKALAHVKKLNDLEKQQLLADRNGAIARLNIVYDIKKKESLLQKQSSELTTLRLQKRFTIITIFLLFVVLGLAIFFFQLSRKNQLISLQNEELVKEQNHRVKNNLQVVSSLLRLQADRLTDQAARQAIEESQLRIQSMALLHQKLYDGEHLAMVALEEFIPDLVSGVLQTYDQSHVAVQFNIAPVYLSADKATPLSLIINELITNACKYAFTNNPLPELRISCSQNGHKIWVEIADNGPGLSKANLPIIQADDLLTEQNPTFGMSLIETQVAQLNGNGYFSTGGNSVTTGTLFSMKFTI